MPACAVLMHHVYVVEVAVGPLDLRVFLHLFHDASVLAFDHGGPLRPPFQRILDDRLTLELFGPGCGLMGHGVNSRCPVLSCAGFMMRMGCLCFYTSYVEHRRQYQTTERPAHELPYPCLSLLTPISFPVHRPSSFTCI